MTPKGPAAWSKPGGFCITPIQILRSTRRFHSPRGAGFQARNADILVGASGRAPILVAAPPLCGAANPGCRRLSAGACVDRTFSHTPEKPPEKRLQAKLPAPQYRQAFGRIAQDLVSHAA